MHDESLKDVWTDIAFNPNPIELELPEPFNSKLDNY
jgi:hypothetical protein